MKNKKFLAILMLLIISMNIFVITNVTANPNIQVNPENPKPQGTVTFTVNISEIDNIEEVVVYVQECGEEVCFTDYFNETMVNIGNNTYQTTITLKHKDAVKIYYSLGYLSNNTWTWTPSKTMDLDISSNSSESPDTNLLTYALIGVGVSVIFIISYIFYRKRGK